MEQGVQVMAEGATGLSSLTTSLTSAFSTISNDAISAIGSVLPYALPVMGAMIVIGLAIKTFRKAAK